MEKFRKLSAKLKRKDEPKTEEPHYNVESSSLRQQVPLVHELDSTYTSSAASLRFSRTLLGQRHANLSSQSFGDSTPPRYEARITADRDDDVRHLDRLPMPEQPQIIIGIDFGTTHSGASFAYVQPEENIDRVELTRISDWKAKGQMEDTQEKVPSAILYNENGGIRWGFDIPPEAEDTIRWMKLLLEPDLESLKSKVAQESQEVTRAKRILQKLEKTELDVVSDYLRNLWAHVQAQIIKEIGSIAFERAAKIIILTVPAIWSDKAAHNTNTAAVNAGLASKDHALLVVTEPQAAAIEVLKRNVKRDDCYVICDAGGGTVDLISYQVTNTDPIQLQEVVLGDGKLCGSVFIDMKFEAFLRKIISPDVYDAAPARHRKKMMDAFDRLIKRDFDDDPEGPPYTFDLLGVPHNPDIGYDVSPHNDIKIPTSVIRSCFEETCDQIKALVEKQVSALEKRGLPIQGILLVGGLGSNNFLFNELQKKYRSKNIEVRQPDRSWSSIANGAVRCALMGVENVVPIKLSRYSYGFIKTSHFIEGKHHPADRYTCPWSGDLLAKNQVTWLVKKGDRIEKDTIGQFTLSFIIYDPENGMETMHHTVRLVKSGIDNPPARVTSDVSDWVYRDFKINRKRAARGLPIKKGLNGQSYAQRKFSILISRKSTDIDFKFVVDGDILDGGKAELL